MGRGGNSKGRPFELEVCSRLSEWWTNDRRADVYYHTHVSGARATVRAKTGRRTAGAYGDVMATDPIGQPLLDVMVLEIKRGYSAQNLHNWFDRLPSAAIGKKGRTWEEWILQAMASQQQARSRSWAIIAKRDRREQLIAMPSDLGAELECPRSGVWLECRQTVRTPTTGPQYVSLLVMRLEDFLDEVPPSRIKTLATKR